MARADIHIISDRTHCGQVATGFLALEQRRGKDVLQVHLHDDRAQYQGTPESCVPLVLVDYDGTRIAYDLEDGYWTRPRMRAILDECDCYFKRGFSTEENRRRLSPEQQEKMHALGLYISYGKAPLPNPQSGNSKRMAGLDGFGYRVKSVLKPQYTPQGFERPPRGLSQKPTIIFSARLWDPGDVEERYWEDRIAINTMRIGVVRTLRAAFGNCFIGGIEDNPYARKLCPDLVLPKFKTYRKRYLHAMHNADICVATTGLHQSTGGKSGEYVAASKAIVSEQLLYEIPGDFAAHANYLPFTTPEECVDAVNRLLEHPEQVREMQRLNWDYYQNYLRPDRLIERTLEIATKRQETT